MRTKKVIINFLLEYYPQILLIALILLVYIQNLWFDLAYLDDGLIIYADYEKINSLTKIPNAFLSGYLLDHYYRPMILISFIIDTFIAGQSSMMYHLTNVVLHIIFSLLLYNLLIKFSFDKLIALISSIIFSIHPINTNAVSWIAGRNDLIVGVFSLASFLSILKFNESRKLFWFILHQLTFFVALFSKEIGIMILPMIIIYLFLFEKQLLKDKKYIAGHLFFWGVTITLYLYLRLFVVEIHTEQRSGIEYLIKNLYIIPEYLAKLFFFPAITPLSIKNNYLTIFGTIIIIFFLWLLYYLKLHKNKKSLFGLLFFLIFTLPTLAINQRTVSGEFVYIDCRIYLPLVGLIMFFSTAMETKIKNLIIAKIFFIIFFVYSLVFSFKLSSIYKNGESFWTEVTRQHPEVSSHWIGFGFYYFDNKQYLKAANLVEKAIELRNDIPEYYHKASLAYERAGELNKSNQLLKRVLELEKDKSVALVELIKNNLRLGNISEAQNYKEEFVKIDISDPKKSGDLYSSLAYYFSYSNLFDVSIELMKKAIESQPKNSTFLNDLGVFYYNVGKLDSAKHYFREALKIDPSNSEYALNLNRLDNIKH